MKCFVDMRKYRLSFRSCKWSECRRLLGTDCRLEQSLQYCGYVQKSHYSPFSILVYMLYQVQEKCPDAI